MLVDGAVEDRAEGVERERTLLEVSDGPVVTLVRMAGLNVHLNNKRGTVQEVSFSATQKPLQQICSHFTSNGGTVNQSIFFYVKTWDELPLHIRARSSCIKHLTSVTYLVNML